MRLALLLFLAWLRSTVAWPWGLNGRRLIGLLLVGVPIGVIIHMLRKWRAKVSLPTSIFLGHSKAIAGGGTAGCVLANRLSEDSNCQVLLLEAGVQSESEPRLAMPCLSEELLDTEVDWAWRTVPQRFTSNRSHVIHAGKVVGGSSSINRMVHSRGLPKDFTNLWDIKGWLWNDVLPYFEKSEHPIPSGERKSSPSGIGKGPISVSSPGGISTASRVFLSAGLDLLNKMGESTTKESNCTSVSSASLLEFNILETGERCSSSVAYLTNSIRKRKNLTVCTQARVCRLIFDGRNRIVGVEYLSGRDSFKVVRSVRCRKNGEVILSAGAIGSPHLLLLSGIGNRIHLRDKGIALIRNMPTVGRDLQDQLCVAVSWESKKPLLCSKSEIDTWKNKLDWKLFGKGPFSIPPFQAAVYARSSVCSLPAGIPDLQIYFSPILPKGLTQRTESAHPTDPIGDDTAKTIQPQHGFTLWISLLHPESRGTVSLRSSSWRQSPYIDPHYLENTSDVIALLEGYKLARTIVMHPSFDELRETEILDRDILQRHPSVDSEDYMMAFIKKNVTSASHPCGTCRMGTESTHSVVNPHLQVHSVEGLRVVDASVFPTPLSGPMHASCVMLAERASELIKATRHQPVLASL